MEFTVRKNMLQKILKGMEEFARYINFFCYDEKTLMIQARGYDNNHKNQVLVDVLLTPQSSGGVLECYNLTGKEPLLMRLTVKDLSSKLNRETEEDKKEDHTHCEEMEEEKKEDHTDLVTMRADASTLIAQFTVRSKDGCSDNFSLVMVPLSYDDQYLPKVSHTQPLTTAVMSVSKFLQNCTEFSFCKEGDDYVLIGIPKPKLLQFAVWDANWNWGASQMDGNWVAEKLVRIEVETPLSAGCAVDQIQLKYLKYFKYLMKDEPETSQVAISLGAHYPVVMVKYNVTPTDYIKFYLGPRPDIEDLQPSFKPPSAHYDAYFCDPRGEWYGIIPVAGAWGMFSRCQHPPFKSEFDEDEFCF